MSEELKKVNQQEKEEQQDELELDYDDLSQVSGGVGVVINSTQKSLNRKRPIEMPPMKL